MKDDRILKPRLRLCPFCGAAGKAELGTSGAVAFVICHNCDATGPVFYIEDYISGAFHEMSREEQDEEWSNAKIAAQHDAMKSWNSRPWEGQYFPEELENFERKMKQESGAVYGKSVYEEDETDGSSIH